MASHPTGTSVLESFGTPQGVQPGEAHSWISDRGPHQQQVRVGVDLGEDNHGQALGHLVAAAAPTILILTHDDNDHIGGWNGFAPTGLNTLHELWIPYEWILIAAAYHDITTPGSAPGTPRHTPGTAADHLHTTFTSNPHHTETQTMADLIGTPPPKNPHLTPKQRNEMIKQITDQATLAEDDDGFFSAKPGELVDRVMEGATVLDGIIRSCLRAGVRVRLFSVDHSGHGNARPWRDSGSPGAATIANAVEVFPAASFGPLTAFHLVGAYALTVQNRRALCPVLWHRPDDLYGAALIWSDSSGSWTNTLSAADLQDLFGPLTISTAPHHGSDNSAHNPAWKVINNRNTDNPLTMVRAGGQGNQRTRREYLAHPHDLRRCTRCRCAAPWAKPSQTVTVTTNAAVATITTGTRCS